MFRHHVIMESLTVKNALVRCLIIVVLFLSIIYGKTQVLAEAFSYHSIYVISQCSSKHVLINQICKCHEFLCVENNEKSYAKIAE